MFKFEIKANIRPEHVITCAPCWLFWIIANQIIRGNIDILVSNSIKQISANISRPHLMFNNSTKINNKYEIESNHLEESLHVFDTKY